ncbi:Ltp family lipoprotein [Microbacterium sp. 22242]|uniref:Ltp family lipoprotein n=1 Tax=Microbacterium sp. 22242 TaxID=3453896 RepID=UPI003F849B1A
MSDQSAPGAGWYDDGSGRQRWWDGQQWGQYAVEAPAATVPLQDPQIGAGAKKPWYRRVWVWIVVGVVVLFGVIGGINNAIAGKAPVAEPSHSASATTEAAADILVPDLTGMKGDVARNAVEVAGLKPKLDGGGSVVVMASNWTVTSQEPAAGASVKKGTIVTIHVEKPKSVQADPPKSDPPAAPAAPAVSAEFRSALTKAGQYSTLMHMSKAGIYDQLTSEYGEKFSAEAAQYAIDNVKADWNANALAKAKEYQNQMAMSPEGIRDQLTSDYGEKFTADEADYAIQHLND